MMNFKLFTRALVIINLMTASLDGISAEVRTSSGVPKIGDVYQNFINVDEKRKIILPDGSWQVNNSFDDKESNWHASWRVVTLTNNDQQAPFRLMIVRYFSQSTPRWLTEDCEKKNNPYGFGQDTNGSKGGRTICSQFFYWSNPQELVSLTLPKLFSFHFSKALSKLSSEFIQTLAKDQLFFEVTGNQNGGLYVKQEILIDTNKLGINAEDFKKSYSLVSDDLVKKLILKWRTAYTQSFAQAYLDSIAADPSTYAFNNSPNESITKPSVKLGESASIKKSESSNSVSSNLENEKNKLEADRKLFEEQKKLAEERRLLEEERKKSDLEAIQRQKELLSLQEQRSELEKKQLEKKQSEDNKKKEEAEKREAAEKARAAELAKSAEVKKIAAEAKKVEEEERKKIEAYKKTPPVIEIAQSEPDEFGAVILDIAVSKPTKSLTINGEAEGPSKDGKYRVKRVLKKNGKTVFTFNATDEYDNKVSSNWTSELKKVAKSDETGKVSTKNSLQCWSSHTSCNSEELLKLSKSGDQSTSIITTITFISGGCRSDSFFNGVSSTFLPEKIKCEESNGIFMMNISGCKQSYLVKNKLDAKPPQKRLIHHEISGACAESQIYAFKKLKERKSDMVYNLIYASDGIAGSIEKRDPPEADLRNQNDKQSNEKSSSTAPENNQSKSNKKYTPVQSKKYVGIIACESGPDTPDTYGIIKQALKIHASGNPEGLNNFIREFPKWCTKMDKPAKPSQLEDAVLEFENGGRHYLSLAVSNGFQDFRQGGSTVMLPTWTIFGLVSN